MKILNMGKGIEVRTPWLAINEAAAYCSMSREKFLRLTEKYGTSYGGEAGNNRCYHAQALDAMLRHVGRFGAVSTRTGEEEKEC